MAVHRYMRRTHIQAPAERVFRWHEQPAAFEKLVPPGELVRVMSQTGGIRNGGRAELAIGRWPARIRWIAEHDQYVEDRQFRDVQTRGPFRRWEHTHIVEPDGPDACHLEDRVEYELPFGWLGETLLGNIVASKIERLFEYRHHVTRMENEDQGRG